VYIVVMVDKSESPPQAGCAWISHLTLLVLLVVFMFLNFIACHSANYVGAGPSYFSHNCGPNILIAKNVQY
jgi:hypothetical protein